MRSLLSFCILLFSFLSVVSQTQQQISGPNIGVKDLHEGEKPVRISDVNIDVKVVGALAVTTVDITFYNPNSRILEGELTFPLAEGQSISRFALDINGKLREGVVIERAKGQAVFESTIRQKVDPGLLEKVQGNNFRTRVYPLPAKGTRRVVIAYEQELHSIGNNYRFFLPVEYKDTLDNFDVKLSVFTKDHTPVIDRTPWGNFRFDKTGEAYTASYSARKYPAKGQIVFSVPIDNEIEAYVENGKISTQTVFYSQISPEIIKKEKQLVKQLDIYWDISSSMSDRNLALELEMLDKYFSKMQNLTVNLFTFNCVLSIPQSFVIRNSNWSELKAYLEKLKYDGATQIGLLDFRKSKSDEILLFTDGMSNLGKTIPISGKIPVNVINSSLNADYSLLRHISQSSGGKYINLMQTEPQKALGILENENYRLISVEYDKKQITDLATSDPVVNAEKSFSVAGILLTNEAKVTLNFGVGTKILNSKTFVVSKKNINDYNGIVEKIWAAKKIDELDLLYEKNKEEIEAIGRKYNIITRNTSLIVLDDVQDYVRHKITPPAELLNEYNSLLRQMEEEKKEELEDKLADVVNMFENRKEWWNKVFEVKKEKPKKVRVNSRSGNTEGVIRQSASFTGNQVRGTIVDADNEPIIGVTIKIKDTTIGTVSDLDGKYTLNVNRGDVLVFSYVGFNSLEVAVSGSELDVRMQEHRQELSEVVVTGNGRTDRGLFSGSAESVDAESLPDMTNHLQGRIAGVSISSNENEAAPEIRIRGNSSLSDGATPMYVVDGEIVSDISSFDPNEIESMSVLKDNSATAIYGARASNGVVIISTKGDSTSVQVNKSETQTQAIEGRNRKGSIQLNVWEPDADYLKELNLKSDNELYSAYLVLKEEYKMTPSFYLDVANLFEKRGLKEQAFVILSNLAELKIDDYRLLRVLAHRLKQLNYNHYAIGIFKKVLDLRPEEPQSHRDLGLAYIQNKDYQEGINILYTIIEKDWDGRFDEIELFAIEEINNAIGKAKRSNVKLDLKKIDKRLIFDMPLDIRIVLNWDTDNSDMDLWVTDPNEEKCFYGNSETKVGGIISDDYTDGYGPEEFLLKKAPKGKYKIQANYFGTREQTLVGPTTIYLEVYTNYSRSTEKKETITLQLIGNKEVIDIGEIAF